jgi:hypothetical protein
MTKMNKKRSINRNNSRDIRGKGRGRGKGERNRGEYRYSDRKESEEDN